MILDLKVNVKLFHRSSPTQDIRVNLSLTDKKSCTIITPTMSLAETITEQRATPERLSPAEMGKLTYDAMTGITTRLSTTPEFATALSQAFFRRQSSRHTSRNEIPSVTFSKGDFTLVVDWSSTKFEPGSHGEPERRDMIRSQLTITKYDPQEATDGWLKKIARVTLITDFLENEQGEIIRFTGGTAEIGENFDLASSFDRPHSWRSANPIATLGERAAIERIPVVFPELYPAPIKL